MTPGYQIAQTAHSVAAFAFSRTKEFHQWHENSQYIVALTVNNEQELEELLAKAFNNELTPIPFREPDLDDSLTSIALVPHAANKKMLSGLPLAGRHSGNVNKHSKSTIRKVEVGV